MHKSVKYNQNPINDNMWHRKWILSAWNCIARFLELGKIYMTSIFTMSALKIHLSDAACISFNTLKINVFK